MLRFSLAERDGAPAEGAVFMAADPPEPRRNSADAARVRKGMETMKHCAIVGINWGDEGKGRMVDLLTEKYDVVIRYQGGGNAGHTVVNEFGKFALHLLPSGIFRRGVLNILEEFVRKFGRENLPQVVVSGFHLMRKTGYDDTDVCEQEEIARRLMDYPCRFYTCHCTGVEPFARMKEIMGERLEYIHTGGKIDVR